MEHKQSKKKNYYYYYYITLHYIIIIIIVVVIIIIAIIVIIIITIIESQTLARTRLLEGRYQRYNHRILFHFQANKNVLKS